MVTTHAAALDGRRYRCRSCLLYTSFKNLDTDLKYTFDRQGQMESFVRLYRLTHRYEGRDTYTWSKLGTDAARAASVSYTHLDVYKRQVYANPDEEFNAFATLGRVMSINKGALDTLDDDQLAYVMAHEIAHGEHKDIINGAKKQIGLSTAVGIEMCIRDRSGQSKLMAQMFQLTAAK